MKSEYFGGIIIVGSVLFVLLALWVPVIFTGRRLQNKKLYSEDIIINQMQRDKVVYLLNKKDKQ